VNVEEWDIEKPIVRQYVPAPQGVVPIPDVQNWSWHEFGLRVGFWRILDARQSRNIRGSAAVNARLCETYEPIARAMRTALEDFKSAIKSDNRTAQLKTASRIYEPILSGCGNRIIQ
jgi:allantoinase